MHQETSHAMHFKSNFRKIIKVIFNLLGKTLLEKSSKIAKDIDIFRTSCISTQLKFTCSNSTMETLEKGVKKC